MNASSRVERMNAELSKVGVKHVTLYSDKLWIHEPLFFTTRDRSQRKFAVDNALALRARALSTANFP